LKQIEDGIFCKSSLQSIIIPRSIQIIDSSAFTGVILSSSDAVEFASRIKFIDENPCPEFDRWLQLRPSGIAIDFRRIQRLGFDLPSLGDHIVNLSVFEERSIICDSDEVRNGI
jgi:hypothetical protein